MDFSLLPNDIIEYILTFINCERISVEFQFLFPRLISQINIKNLYKIHETNWEYIKIFTTPRYLHDDVLKKLVNLTDLNYCYNEVLTNDSIKKLTYLKRLRCSWNTNISYEGIKELNLDHVYCGFNTTISKQLPDDVMVYP